MDSDHILLYHFWEEGKEAYSPKNIFIYIWEDRIVSNHESMNVALPWSPHDAFFSPSFFLAMLQTAKGKEAQDVQTICIFMELIWLSESYSESAGPFANGFVSSSYSWVLVGTFAAVILQCGFLGAWQSMLLCCKWCLRGCKEFVSAACLWETWRKLSLRFLPFLAVEVSHGTQTCIHTCT